MAWRNVGLLAFGMASFEGEQHVLLITLESMVLQVGLFFQSGLDSFMVFGVAESPLRPFGNKLALTVEQHFA